MIESLIKYTKYFIFVNDLNLIFILSSLSCKSSSELKRDANAVLFTTVTLIIVCAMELTALSSCSPLCMATLSLVALCAAAEFKNQYCIPHSQ